MVVATRLLLEWKRWRLCSRRRKLLRALNFVFFSKQVFGLLEWLLGCEKESTVFFKQVSTSEAASTYFRQRGWGWVTLTFTAWTGQFSVEAELFCYDADLFSFDDTFECNTGGEKIQACTLVQFLANCVLWVNCFITKTEILFKIVCVCELRSTCLKGLWVRCEVWGANNLFQA